MDSEILKTVSLCSLFVFLVGSVGGIIAIIINAISIYIRSPSANMYSALIKNQLFASQYVHYYILAGLIFAGIESIIIYMWIRKNP